MRIVVIGATGTIGGAVADALEARHDVVRASRHGAVQVDLGDPSSIDAMFAANPNLDAVVCCAANTELAPFASQSDAQFADSMASKLFGQVALVRRAVDHLRDQGSVTLTSGTFDEPIAGSAAGALVNAGLEGFVRAAALEMPRGLRLNVVSPGWVAESLAAADMDTAEGTAAADVARAYLESVEGTAQGRTLSPQAPPPQQRSP